MKELVEIFDDTTKGVIKFLCFPVRLCYWCCKEFLKMMGVIE